MALRAHATKPLLFSLRGALLFVIGLIASLAGFGTANTTSSKSKLKRHQAVAVVNTTTHAPNGPSNPEKLGRAGGAFDGWQLRLTSVTPTAVQFLGEQRQATPENAQEFMVNVNAKYLGGGHNPIHDLFART